MKCHIRWIAGLLGVCLFGLAHGTASAQLTTTKTETLRFEVVSVDGNKVVARSADGAKEYTVPEDFRFNVGGQQLSVHDLKPGMKGTATITTTTTVKPVTVTEVRNATVMQVSGGTILVRGANGFRSFTQGELDKRNVKIMKNGEPVEISQLHSGDHLTATIITEKPPQVLTQRQVQATIAAGGGSTPTPAAPPASASAGTSSARTSSARTSSAGASSAGTSSAGTSSGGAASGGGTASPKRSLPKTASGLPLIGIAGLASLAIGVALTVRRRRMVR
jgi:LPXTG-motif cell wall-anchored protein